MGLIVRLKSTRGVVEYLERFVKLAINQVMQLDPEVERKMKEKAVPSKRPKALPLPPSFNPNGKKKKKRSMKQVNRSLKKSQLIEFLRKM